MSQQHFKTILIIDDSDDDKLLHQALIERLGYNAENGYRIMQARNAEEGLGIYQSLETKPVLVITDCDMEHHGSGFKVIAQIRENGGEMAIIMASGEDVENRHQIIADIHAKGFGATHFVSKNDLIPRSRSTKTRLMTLLEEILGPPPIAKGNGHSR